MIGTDGKNIRSQKSAWQDWGLTEVDQEQGEPTNPSERSLQILGKEGTNPKEGAYASYKSMYLTFTLSC